jgi:cell division protein FtsL
VRGVDQPLEKSVAVASVVEMKLINITRIFILLYEVIVASAVALHKAFL